MQKTTKALTVSALALGLVALATSAIAAPATSGIASTRHNLGSSNRTVNGLTTNTGGKSRAGDIYTTGTDEICVFCHTPHASNTAVNAPLWNKALPASTYTVYSSGTMQGTASLANNNMSLACLSCHDGTQAMDNMINKPTTGGNPGSAGWNATGSRLAGTWYAGTDDAEATGNTVGGALNAKIYMELGTDLSNDHPVGIPYCGGGQTGLGKTGCADQDFNAVTQGANATSFVVGSSAVMKENMRLYNTAGGLSVECGSCHDPHNDAQKTFLRISNAGSAVCLTCHAK